MTCTRRISHSTFGVNCLHSALFACTALTFKHLRSVYNPGYYLHFYLHYLHFYLHYLHFCLHCLHYYLHCLHFYLHCLHYYLHICLHYLHICLHCVDFQVVSSVYNQFFVCTTIYTTYVLHNHTRVSVVRAVPVSFNGIGRARNLSEQPNYRPPYARQARLLCHKKSTAVCNACRRQCIQYSDLSTLCKALKISAVHTKSVECRQNSKKDFSDNEEGDCRAKIPSFAGWGGYPLITATGSKRVLTFTRSASL